MKKLIVLGLTILSCGLLHALPIGNPAEASLLCDGVFWEGSCCLDPCDPCTSWCDLISVRIGYYGDFVYNRHLEIDEHDRNDKIEHTGLYTNAGYIAANLGDRLDLFGTLGASHISISTNAAPFGNGLAPLVQNGGRFEIDTTTHFSWSIGARATVWECGCTFIGLETQYFFTKPKIARVTSAITGDVESAYPDGSLDMKYREWQIGFGLAHRINMFVPYFAVKWSKAKIDMDNGTVNFAGLVDNIVLRNLESRKNWGYAIGVTFIDCEKLSTTLEGRWSDEKAIYVNGQVRF